MWKSQGRSLIQYVREGEKKRRGTRGRGEQSFRVHQIIEPLYLGCLLSIPLWEINCYHRDRFGDAVLHISPHTGKTILNNLLYYA